MSDDNKVKFLKIQYSLLRALKEKKEKAINNVIYEQIENEIKRELIKYKELVTSIDRGIYLELKDKISLFKPHTKSLEEEINFFLQEKITVLELHYNSSHFECNGEQIYSFSCLILYKEK